jgi:hypothetical protein
MNIVEIRDDLNTVRDLIEVCISALSCREGGDTSKVVNVLHFHVMKQLEIIDENLQEMKEF